MLDAEFVEILKCPQDRASLHMADSQLLARLNRAIEAGRIKNQAGRTVEGSLQGGLVRQDGALLYPILDDIPVLLAEEAVPLSQLDTSNGKP